MQAQGEDRRLFDRFQARFPAKFEDAREDFGKKIVLRDASAHGLRFFTSEQLFLNDNIALEVKLPDGQDPMPVKGQVVWTHRKQDKLWDVGIQLHQLSLMKMSRLYSAATDSREFAHF